MSKAINVNPDHYKVAGRERPGHPTARNAKEPPSGTEETRAWKWRNEQKEREKSKGKK